MEEGSPLPGMSQSSHLLTEQHHRAIVHRRHLLQAPQNEVETKSQPKC